MPKQVGLSAVLKFAGDAAVSGMRRASGAFRQLSFNAQQLKAGMRDVKQGMAGMTVAGAAVGAAAGFTVKKFADFDGQMGAVKAVLGSARAKDFPALTAEAKKLGATTAFTATQAAEAMENLARSGQSPKEIMASIGPVLAAAAAEGMDLGTAADIVASNLKAFSLGAGEATRVADTLAFVSAKTNTNMSGLQEGLKFVGPIAAGMKIPIEDTAGALGVLADVGLKGSLAGTGLKNALLKIAKGAKNGMVKVGKFNVEVKKTADGGVDLSGTMLGITKALANIKDPLARTNAGMALLGLRGQGAASAFGALKQEKVDLLFKNMAAKAKGSAAEMAKMRLDNLKGDFTLLSSAVDGVVNSLGGALAGSVRKMIGKGGVGGLTGTLSQASAAFAFFGANADQVGKDTPIAIQGVSKEVMALVRGFLRGIQDVKAVFSGLFGAIKRVGTMFGLSAGEGSSGMARLVTGALGLSVAIAPIGLAIKGATKLFGPFAKVGLGAFKMLSAGIKPLLGGLSKLGGGILDKIGAKKLPGAAGALGKAISGVEKITANPVRVVNFDEMRGGGLLGQKQTPGTTGAAGGMFARARAGLAGFVGRFGRVGAVLNSGLGAIAKGGMGLGAKLGIFGGAVAAAGAAGYTFGRWLDKKFGISDKLANGLHNLFRAAEIEASKRRVAAHGVVVANEHAARMLHQWVKFSEAGRKKIDIHGKGGKVKSVALTQEMARKRMTEFLKQQGNTPEQIKKMIEHMKGEIMRLPEKIQVDVNVDSKKVASAVGGKRIEGKERGATPSRRTAAAGAAP